MNDKKTNASNQAQQYLIISTITKKPYIDEKRQAHLFVDTIRAEQFLRTVPPGMAVYKDLSQEKLKSICSWCYAAGAEYIIITDGEKPAIRKLSERHLDKNYYNCRLSADLALLQHTKKMKYVTDLKNCEFIVPIRISNGESVSIVYATASKGDNKHYMYLAFTDLYEYKKWEKQMGDEWKPLAVDIDGLKRIGKKHGFIINPLGGRIVLNNEILKKVKSNEDDEDDD